MKRLAFVFVLPLLFLSLSTAQAGTYVAFGGYGLDTGDDQVTGSVLELGLSLPFNDYFSHFYQVSSSYAEGTHLDEAGQSHQLTADTTGLSAGVMAHYSFKTKPNLVPYLGLGVTATSYNLDFEYEGSEVGTTSGSGLGPLVRTGVRVELSRVLTLTPGYYWEQLNITTQGGEKRTITSQGTTLALTFTIRY